MTLAMTNLLFLALTTNERLVLELVRHNNLLCNGKLETVTVQVDTAQATFNEWVFTVKSSFCPKNLGYDGKFGEPVPGPLPNFMLNETLKPINLRCENKVKDYTDCELLLKMKEHQISTPGYVLKVLECSMPRLKKVRCCVK